MPQRISNIPRRLNLPKKLPHDPKETPEYLKQLVQSLNDQNDIVSGVVQEMQGADPLDERPTAGIKGRTWYATDNGHFYVDDGTNWIQLV